MACCQATGNTLSDPAARVLIFMSVRTYWIREYSRAAHLHRARLCLPSNLFNVTLHRSDTSQPTEAKLSCLLAHLRGIRTQRSYYLFHVRTLQFTDNEVFPAVLPRSIRHRLSALCTHASHILATSKTQHILPFAVASCKPYRTTHRSR